PVAGNEVGCFTKYRSATRHSGSFTLLRNPLLSKENSALPTAMATASSTPLSRHYTDKLPSHPSHRTRSSPPTQAAESTREAISLIIFSPDPRPETQGTSIPAQPDEKKAGNRCEKSPITPID